MFVSNVNNNKSLPSRSFCVLFLWPLCWTWSVVHVVGRLDLDGVRPVVSRRQNPATDVCHLPIKIINKMKKISIFKLLLTKKLDLLQSAWWLLKSFKWSFHTKFFSAFVEDSGFQPFFEYCVGKGRFFKYQKLVKKLVKIASFFPNFDGGRDHLRKWLRHIGEWLRHTCVSRHLLRNTGLGYKKNLEFFVP